MFRIGLSMSVARWLSPVGFPGGGGGMVQINADDLGWRARVLPECRNAEVYIGSVFVFHPN